MFAGKKANLWLPYIAIAIAVAALYGRTLSFDFIPSWDDKEYVVENILIQSLSAGNLKRLFTETYFSNYAPLHLLSYSVDFALWGLDPAGYHLTNVVLHFLNACLLFALLSRLLNDRVTALMAALLFAVHPINIENAAWISERKTLLTSFFSFLSMLSYLSFREGKGLFHYALAFVFFLLALLSKPLTVTLPLALIAYELFIKKERRGWVKPVPLFLLSTLGAGMAFWAHLSHKSIEGGSLSLDVLFGTVYPTMVPVYWKYIRLILWPFDLSGFYDTTLFGSFAEPVVAVSLVAWIVLTIAILWKGTGQMRFWYLWFWIWLMPVANIIPIPVYYADRYMYIPAIAVFVLFGSVLSYIKDLNAARKTAYAAFAVVFLFYGAVAFERVGVWRNELSFWQDTAAKSPGQDKAQLNLGYAYEMAGRLEEAEKAYEAAARIYPSQEAVSNLAMVREKIEYLRNKR
ncbi:MAG: tetratricopeptide repeat protein [Deltaproteobacteria bacterium]|nr:tetratricopeptide repeat protein [Deltaproteobacteria bacterium]